MLEPDNDQETENIKKKISSNLEGINEKSRNYIKDIAQLQCNREPPHAPLALQFQFI